MTESNGSPYVMRLDLHVLDHLGLNLYSNTPAVISEAVANSWDADAEQVEIEIDTHNQVIRITDDGCGMTKEEVNEKYLRVGYRRREEATTTPTHNRHVMGRKGIGKLSLSRSPMRSRSRPSKTRAEISPKVRSSCGRKTFGTRWYLALANIVLKP